MKADKATSAAESTLGAVTQMSDDSAFAAIQSPQFLWPPLLFLHLTALICTCSPSLHLLANCPLQVTSSTAL